MLNLRVYGTEGGLEWHQEEPNYLIFKPSKAPAEVLKRGNEYLCEAAKKVSRLPPGHPEAFIEAFANIYSSVAATIRSKSDNYEPDGLEQDFPTVYDGAKGVHFIEKAVESSRSEKKWSDTRW